MTNLTDSDVIRTLQNAVKEAVAASDIPLVPIQFLGKTLDQPDDFKWLELVLIPNNQDNFWGDETTFQGILRLILHWPLNNEGVYSPFDLLASITKYFKKTEPLHGPAISLQIYQKPITSGMIPTERDNLFPASLSYRSFQP